MVASSSTIISDENQLSKAQLQYDPFIEIFNENIVTMFKDALRFSLNFPRYFPFLLSTIGNQRRAVVKREKFESQGLHVPPFLIFSITHRCNLQCKGCYAHAFNPKGGQELSDKKMAEIIDEASALGISIILIAGGEPMVRPELFQIMGNHPEIIFPVFTNGTLLNEEKIQLIRKYKNIIPVISIEGHLIETDTRRGTGIYGKILQSMKLLKANKIIFGSSITLTQKNFDIVTSEAFAQELILQGAKVVFYIDYVPIQENTENLVLTEVQARKVPLLTVEYQKKFPALFIGFPGDEENLGGCLSAGRGFLHISPEGRIEPCPFAPYSDMNLQEKSLKEALQSKLLTEIRKNHDRLVETRSGCALWQQKDWLKTLK